MTDGTASDEPDEEDEGSEEEIEKQDIQEKDTRENIINQASVLTVPKTRVGAAHSTINSEGYTRVSKNSPLLEPGNTSYGFIDQEGTQWQKYVSISCNEETSASRALPGRRKSVSFASKDYEPSRVETQEESEVDPDIFIRFKHSENECLEPPANQVTENGEIILVS